MELKIPATAESDTKELFLGIFPTVFLWQGIQKWVLSPVSTKPEVSQCKNLTTLFVFSFQVGLAGSETADTSSILDGP